MATTMQFVFVLSMLVSIAVCDPVFKLVNSFVQLDVTKKIPHHDLAWIFNESDYIVKYTGRLRIYAIFEGRMKLDEETHSLTLYNLQKNDSGLYQAEYSDAKKQIVATYQINVLDPVTRPVFKTSCLPSNNTYVKFTCEAQKLSITSSCNNDKCDIKEQETEDGLLSLSMYISNNSIICSHRNPVSWENTTKEIRQMTQHCTSQEVPKNPKDPSKIPLIAIVIVIIVLLATPLVVIICRRKKCGAGDLVDTVYEAVDPVKKGENNAQSVEMSERPEHPGTVYCTVGKPAEACSNDESTVRTANPGNKEMKRMRSDENCNDRNPCDTPDKNQGEGNAYQELESSLPQTIYATVNKTSKPM